MSTQRPRLHPRARRTLAAAALAGFLPLTLSACGESIEKAAEEAAEKAIEDANGGGDVDIDVDSGEVKVESSDGSYSAGQGLPEDFPVDEIPLVGEVRSGSSVNTGEGKGWTVSTETDLSPADAVAEATAKLEGAGFSDQGSFGGTNANLGDDKYGVLINTADTGTGATTIVYVVSQTS